MVEGDAMSASKMSDDARNKLESSPLHVPRKLEDVSLIPSWARIALARYTLEGYSLEEAAKSVKHAKATLAQYTQSPAGKRWMEIIADIAADPKEIARATLGEHTLRITMDNLWALEAAKEVGDYEAVHKYTKWLLERPEVLGAVAKQENNTYVIQMPPGATLDMPMGASSHEVKQLTQGADYEIVEDDDDAD